MIGFLLRYCQISSLGIGNETARMTLLFKRINAFKIGISTYVIYSRKSILVYDAGFLDILDIWTLKGRI